MAEIKGILGTKLGMTQIFDDTRAIPVTVIKAGPCFVAQVKTEEKDGYSAVQLAFGATRPNGLTKPEQGHFDKHGGQTGRNVVEIRTDDRSSGPTCSRPASAPTSSASPRARGSPA
jgi:large subunit ribosomal protein L3